MTRLPQGLLPFLDQAGWGGAIIHPIPGDASFRRYFRVRTNGRRAMVMYAPPPEEDVVPFIVATEYLTAHSMRAPTIHARDAAQGWLLIEDFGDSRMRDWLDENPQGEDGAYRAAIDTLVSLHTKPPGPFAAYDAEAYGREVALFTEWYCPAMEIEVDEAAFFDAWSEVLKPLDKRRRSDVTVLRDYHAENIMLLNPVPDGSGPQGLIDFQDALVGHPAYDLVSLLQDARRDVSTDLERRMLRHYIERADPGLDFKADYARLGAQRNAKIIGIFTRLYRRDGKPQYLDYLPRVWAVLERDLAHPALEPVSRWFDVNIPRELRDDLGGRPA
ncbi:MAG: phosphotransferase [Pontixanthobacter sp.]